MLNVTVPFFKQPPSVRVKYITCRCGKNIGFVNGFSGKEVKCHCGTTIEFDIDKMKFKSRQDKGKEEVHDIVFEEFYI